MPLDVEQYMSKCTRDGNPDLIQCVVQAVNVKSQNNETWVCPVTIATLILEVEQAVNSIAELPKTVLKRVQEEDAGLVAEAQWLFLLHTQTCKSLSKTSSTKPLFMVMLDIKTKSRH